MTREPERFFALLDPPPGGAERLRERLVARAGSSRARAHPRLAVGLSVLVCAALGFVLLSEDDPASSDAPTVAAAPDLIAAPELDRLLGRPLQTSGTRVVVDGRPVTLAELDSRRANVRIFAIDRARAEAQN